MVCLDADGDVSLFCQSEINFSAITTWENEDVMRKWDVVLRSNRFQAQLVAVSSVHDSDQSEDFTAPQWPIRRRQVTLSAWRLPADCSNSDNNLTPGVGAGHIIAGENVRCENLTAITFTFLDSEDYQQGSWLSAGAGCGPRYWYSNVLLTVKYYFHKMPGTDMFSSHVIWAPLADHVAVYRHPQTRVHKYRGPPFKRKSYRYLKDLLLYSFLSSFARVISSPSFEIVVKPYCGCYCLRLDFQVKRMDWLMFQLPPPLSRIIALTAKLSKQAPALLPLLNVSK